MVAKLVTLRPGRACGGGASHAVSGQCLCSGSGGILDRSGVMVLVASESRASGESLLAIRIRALVRSLTRMYPTMPSQRTAVAEGLRGPSQFTSACSWMCWSAHLSTTLTHVRLLSSVDSLVDGQGRPLDELLAAVGVVADMRPHSGVDSL